MPGITNLSPDDIAWNFVWLDGLRLPGIAHPVTAKKARKIDKQSVKGSDGLHLTDEGIVPGEMDITLTISTDEQWQQWEREVQPRIDPELGGGLRKPLAIRHPEAAAKRIELVYVTEINSSSPEGGVKVERISCIQWFPPKKANTTRKRAETSLDVALRGFAPNFQTNTFGLEVGAIT